MGISVTFDTAGYAKRVRDFMQASVSPAMQDAVLYLAASARLRLRETAPAYLQNPVPWTLAAFAFSPARSPAGTASAIVYVQRQQAQYLRYAILGGDRVAGDYATTAGGPLLPGRDAVLDANGNLPRGYVEAAISRGARWVHLRPDAPLTLILPGRQRGRPEVLAAIVPSVHYEKRFPFREIVEDAVRAKVPEAARRFRV